MVSKSNKKACIFCVLLSSCIISSMVQTALNTALALIMEEMSVSAGTAQWLASSYSLVMGIMVLSTAFLIRRYPSRPLYLSFMSLFSLGLLLAALSPSFWVLLLGRVLQAVGCGLLMSLTQVVILSVYPPETRGSVMGLYGLAVCAAPVLAPTLTGIIIDSMGWQMVFWIALGASVITLGIGFFTMGNVTETTPISFDILSLLLCAAGFASLVVGLGNWSSYKFVSVPVLGLVVGGLGFLLLFVKRQQQLSVPFLNLKAFANLEFRLSVLSSMLIYCSMMAVSTLLPLYNQSLRGVSATTSGLIMMPGSLVTALISPVAGKMPNGRQNTMNQMRELITQCYNHPSIVCWGLSNEVAVHGITEDLMQNHILLNDLCHEMDKTRPTTMAHPFMLEHESPLIQITDIGSYNLYFGWYMGTLEQNDSFFDEYHEKYPKRIMGFSEYGADANVRFQTAHPEQGDYSEQYQCLYHESLLGTIRRHPWMWATHLWNMFDFAADGRDEGGAHGLNQKGLVTFDRKIKKDAFYLYKATWNKEEPFVHICGRRYVDRTEQETEVRVYSNQHQVTLMVDGQKVDELEGETVFVFKLPISGRHTVKAVADSCQDEITVCKVDHPNKAYCLGKTGSVSNWFDEAEFKSDHYSIRDSFGVLMAHPQTGKLVGDLMRKIVESRGDVAKTAHKNPNLQKMLAGMSFQALLKQAGDSVSEATCKELNAALQKIPK